ncbi:MAG TPA: phosphoribosylanthranilate isomerase [Polyangiales bacterium]|jgi:phosphoribosylanthranilate isomerase
MTAVKICGVTSVEDAQLCVEAGADAIGLNFWAGSPRCVSSDVARAIRAALPPHVLCVGVFVDADHDELLRVKREVGLGCLQLHGDESAELVTRLLPHAYKAIRVRAESVHDDVARYPGEHVLLDAYVPGAHGGTGARFDWHLAAGFVTTRKITLAGGLHPDNVIEAIHSVRPFCVDVASGVELTPRRKDPARVRSFVSRAKNA